MMNAKHVWAKVFILATITVLFLGVSPFAGAADIKIGALNDMTGATSDVGTDYTLGIA